MSPVLERSLGPTGHHSAMTGLISPTSSILGTSASGSDHLARIMMTSHALKVIWHSVRSLADIENGFGGG